MITHSSCVELSRSAYRRNLRFLRQVIGPTARFSSVVKGNAYGHGIDVFLPMAESCGVRHFSVFSVEEALIADRCRGPQTDLLVLGFIGGDALEWAIERDVAFCVFDHERLAGAAAAALRVGRPARIHLETETGMNRTGLADEELPAVLDFIREHPQQLRLEGVFTHLAGAESVANYYRVAPQLQVFAGQAELVRQRAPEPLVRHAACSAALFNYPDSILDMVRVGIAQYGYWPTQETRIHYLTRFQPGASAHLHDPLRSILRWRSLVMGLKRIKRGEFVGYGTAYQAMRNQTVAAVPVGYYHGFSRRLSNLGHVLVRGRRAPVVGYVNMNMMMVDVTDSAGVEIGDEVVIIGQQKRARITVRAFSDLANLVNYEILVHIPATIPRVVVE